MGISLFFLIFFTLFNILTKVVPAARELSDDFCMATYSNRKQEDREFGLANRIVAAYKSNLIDESTKVMAFAIKTRGDKAVHYDPHATKDVAGTIRDTLILLRRLEPG